MPDYVTATTGALIEPLVELWTNVVTIFPSIIAAIVVILVGYVVGWAFGFLIHKVLDRSRIDAQLKKAGLSHSIGFLSVSNLLGGLVKWYIFSLFLIPAAEVLEITEFSRLLRDLALWLPNLFAAIIIGLVGLILADFAADRLLHAKRRGIKVLSGFVRWFIIVFVALIALDQVGVAIDLATNATLLVIAGVSFGLAIAIGYGFGRALQPEAASIIKKIKKDF